MAASVIVELCGPPGSGKSRVAHALVSSLAEVGVAVSEPVACIGPHRPVVPRTLLKLSLVAGELFHAPMGSVRAVCAIAIGQPTLRDQVARSATWLAVRGLIRRSRRLPGVHVFDQGVVQELGSIAYRGASLPTAASGPGRARLGPDVLVRLDVAPAVCAMRLADRPGSESRVERGTVLACEVARFADRSAREAAAWQERWGVTIPTQVLVVPNETGAGVNEVLTAHLCALAGRGGDGRLTVSLGRRGARSGARGRNRRAEEAGCER